MVTPGIKTKREDTMLTDWQPTRERAPSVMLESQPTFTRFLFAIGLLLAAIGSLSLLSEEWHFPYMVSPAWGTLFLSLGVGLILVHAFTEKDEQFRRTYAVAGLMIVGLSLFLRVLPMGSPAVLGGRFLSIGYPGLCLSLVLIGAVLRHETNVFWRNGLTNVLVGMSAVLLIAGTIMVNFYLYNYVGEGVLLMILGVFYTMVAITFVPDVAGFRISLGLGGLGLICIVVGLVRWWAIGPAFLVPSGVVLIGMGALYVAVALGVASDWQIVVLTRREFAAFFYSPIAYPVLIGFAIIAWINFYFFVAALRDVGGGWEPIVRNYIVALIPVFAQMFVVPILTMRLMSEEQRSGTLEVMLTAPVNEISVVISKFLGALAFYMLTWVPMWIFLVSLWVLGGAAFDYRPVLSFSIAVLATGSGFMAMGLFCSTITRNQIIAAVLCFAGMMVHLGIFLIVSQLESPRGGLRELGGMADFFKYISFVDLWYNSLDGQMAPRFLCFHFSLAIFFLFLSLKILESRRWK